METSCLSTWANEGHSSFKTAPWCCGSDRLEYCRQRGKILTWWAAPGKMLWFPFPVGLCHPGTSQGYSIWGTELEAKYGGNHVGSNFEIIDCCIRESQEVTSGPFVLVNVHIGWKKPDVSELCVITYFHLNLCIYIYLHIYIYILYYIQGCFYLYAWIYKATIISTVYIWRYLHILIHSTSFRHLKYTVLGMKYIHTLTHL